MARIGGVEGQGGQGEQVGLLGEAAQVVAAHHALSSRQDGLLRERTKQMKYPEADSKRVR